MKLFSLSLCLLISSTVFARTTPSDVLNGAKVHFTSDVTVGAGDYYAVLTGARGTVRACFLRIPQRTAVMLNLKGQWSAVKSVTETVESLMVDIGLEYPYIQTNLNLENGNRIECHGKLEKFDSLELEDVVLSLESRGIVLE